MNYNYKDAGVTHRQFSHWVAKGWVPGAVPGVGTGNPYRLTAEQLSHIRQMGRLVELGMTPSGAYNAVAKGLGHDVIGVLEGKSVVFPKET